MFALEKFPEKITLKINGGDYELSKPEIIEWMKEDTGLIYNPRYNSEIENIHICEQTKNFLCYLLMPVSKEKHLQKISVFQLDKNAVRNFLKDLARKTDKDPQNATLQMENGRVTLFSMSSPGIKMDAEKSVDQLSAFLNAGNFDNPIQLDYEEIQPEISLDSIDNLGIKELIGEGQSDFKGSPKNRIFNIKVATGRFNGMLIKPNEEFSFVKVLGEVDGEHGYLPELVIKKDKTEPEFGGGICQVSTTAFRAAINSGLEITARRNHAYPVSYYNPQGMDATVYVPRPDLRFINNTSGHILIQTIIEGTLLKFQFYGTADGRRVDIDGPHITEKNSDGSMKTSFTQKVYDSNNNIFIDDTFNSAYDSPSKYPHPGEVFTQKPDGWTQKEWKKYKKEHSV